MRMTVQKRRLAGLVALSYLLGYLLIFAHFVGEQHATCAEHGETHHVEQAEEAPRGAIAAGLSALPVGGDDDHCALLNAVREPVATTDSPTVDSVDLPAPVRITRARLNLPPPQVRAVWRYAPKTSPPSHA